MIAQRVLDQRIHNPRAGAEKYVTISACIATVKPGGRMQPENLLRAAERALQRARSGRDGHIVVAGAKDFS